MLDRGKANATKKCGSIHVDPYMFAMTLTSASFADATVFLPSAFDEARLASIFVDYVLVMPLGLQFSTLTLAVCRAVVKLGL